MNRSALLLTTLAAACAGAPVFPVPEATTPTSPVVAADAAALEALAVATAARGEAVAAVQLLVDAVAAAPDDVPGLDALVRIAAAEQLLPLALQTLRERQDGLGRWFAGRGRYLLAAGQPFERALTTLDAACRDFVAAAQSEPSFRDSSEQWAAMCIGAKGNVAFRQGDLASAQQWLLEALQRRPDLLTTELGGGDSIKLGLLRLGERVMRDTVRTERLFRAAVTFAGDDLDLLNNAAVYALDRGAQLERGGDAAAAQELFERSYTHYRRAVALAPDDVRLRNDCALVAIHHLHRDREAAMALLQAAIADGERTLRDDPPPTARARRTLDEAIGDCYENLALGWLDAGDAAAARAAALASLQHHPGEQRPGARQHLRAAEAKLSGG
ncbi:MAG: hypothetical protein IT455_06200 [Planctomycetes bacterium]|nr:hypothetical protein [Planctomycetota bacterium]